MNFEKLVALNNDRGMYTFELIYLCSKGEVRVNWNTVSKNNTPLKTGDIVSVSGRGRLKVSL